MNVKDPKKASRRGFLGTVASGAAALGIATVASPLQAAAGGKFSVGHTSDIEEWFNKIKGKHRIVFDAPAHNEGMPLAWPRVFQLTNNSNGFSNDQLGIVVAFRHNALPLGMNSALWEKYDLGAFFNINDPVTNAPAKRNFYWQPKAGELMIPGMAINELQESGVLFCVCEMAIFHYSSVIAKKEGLDQQTVQKEWTAGLLPNVQPVPSGVFAVNRSQEHGCSYCFAG